MSLLVDCVFFDLIFMIFIFRELLNVKRCFCLFATHFNELTKLADESEHVANLKVTYMPQADNSDIQMLYRVDEGVCDQKFGIQVAKMVDFPTEIIEVFVQRNRFDYQD